MHWPRTHATGGPPASDWPCSAHGAELEHTPHSATSGHELGGRVPSTAYNVALSAGPISWGLMRACTCTAGRHGSWGVEGNMLRRDGYSWQNRAGAVLILRFRVAHSENCYIVMPSQTTSFIEISISADIMLPSPLCFFQSGIPPRFLSLAASFPPPLPTL